MKKSVVKATALVAALLFGLAACANGNNDNEPETPATVEATVIDLSDATYVKNSAQTDETNAKANPDHLAMWFDQNWCGSAVTVGELTATKDSLAIPYTVTGACTFGIQFFYANATKNGYLTVCTLKSAINQDVEFNGVTYSLTANVAQTVSGLAEVGDTAATIFKLVVPVDATTIGASNTLTISDAKYFTGTMSDLTLDSITISPTTLSIAAGDTGAVAVTGTYTRAINGTTYTVYNAIASSDVTWASEDETVVKVNNGTVTGVAAGTKNVTATVSGKSAACAVTVSAAKEYGKFFSTTSTANGKAEVAVKNPGYLCLWADDNWCGSKVTISAATATKNEYSITRAVTGSCWFGTQMFYAETAGAYSVSFKVTSSVAGDVTINGTVHTLEANVATTISFDSTLTETANLIEIQLGKDGDAQLGDGTFTVSDFSVSTK